MSTEEPTKTQPQIAIGAGGLAPANFDEAYRMANALSRSGMVPNCYANNPSAVFATMQQAHELGIGPMTLLSWTFPLNGRICIWGDAAKGMVLASGLVEDIKEWEEGDTAFCSITRKGVASPIVRKFSLADAKTARLDTKKGPWQDHPMRMCANRCRSWAMRDGFADVLMGLHIAEEQPQMQEAEQRVRDVTPDLLMPE